MILVLVLAIHNMIWHIKILHNLTSHDSIWHNVMILVSIQQHNMIWHIKILHNAQVSQSLEQKSDSFTDKSFRAHTRRTMHTTIGEGDETHIGVNTHTTVEHSHKECNTMHKKVQSHNHTRGWDYSHTRDWSEHLYKITKGYKEQNQKRQCDS